VSSQPKTGREIVLEQLYQEIRLATAGELHRAAAFLKGAREIRTGCKQQRKQSRTDQKNAWKKKVDSPMTW
tara:strand:- start:125 stop:337 length:213 start_codon:yes stop_codon:yes gene_type:complete